MLSINQTQHFSIQFLFSLLVAVGLTGCPDPEDAILGGDDDDTSLDENSDDATSLTLSPDCAKACGVIADCTDGELDEEACNLACSKNIDICVDKAMCVGSFSSLGDGACEYELQCQMEVHPECFEPLDDDDMGVDTCGEACLDPCIDHSVSTCLEKCNGVFAENAESDCAELWTCISENKCTDNDPYPNYDEICGDLFDHSCLY